MEDSVPTHRESSDVSASTKSHEAVTGEGYPGHRYVQQTSLLQNNQLHSLSDACSFGHTKCTRFHTRNKHRGKCRAIFSVPIHRKRTSWHSAMSALLLVLAMCLVPISGQSEDELQQYNVELSVREDAPLNTIVGVIRGDRFSPPYARRIRTQSTSNRTINSFAVNLDTGVVTTTDYLNREVQDSHTIIISTRSSTTPQLIIVEIRVLDINDVKPTFMKPSQDVSISESAPKDHKIPLGSVRDEDLGTNSTQTIEIVSGNEDKDFALEIKTSSNVEKILDLVVTQRKLDYERTTFYKLVIRATDGGGQYSEMTVNINVLDQNDNEPIFNVSKYSKRVAENVTVGTRIIRVQATDSDSGNNSKITYSIDHRTDPEGFFTIDPVTGWVHVNKPLDYETRSRYTLKLEARDNGNSPLLGTAALDVIVENINETPANISLRFEPAFQNGLIPEDTPVDTVVAVVTVDDSDLDAARGQQVALYKDGGYFDLRSSNTSLELVVSKELDRETDATLDMTLQVTDTGFPPLRASHAFTVIIGDVNDNVPIFSQAEYTAEVEETAEVGQEVLRVNATDKDANANGRVTYSLQDGSQHMGWFTVDAVTGAISTRASLDCELSPHPVLMVVAIDGGDPPRVGTAQVSISVRDVNDKEPEFETSFYSIKVAENRRVGDCILTVSTRVCSIEYNMYCLMRLALLLDVRFVSNIVFVFPSLFVSSETFTILSSSPA
ncbi:protein dachsous-like [Plakobranchus ocellatus]|uniref:Protein dachsous-like n=1 Tax=Plakobranchus ocellatus TaxID=259542 RepID=A0AAV3Y511_9GAST|nr:protein dachsous-like [Plakobranchus ocellatus]